MSADAPKDIGIDYPESDGKPMADNTLQWDWMVKIVGELRDQYDGQLVFIAGDLFWYPMRGHPRIVSAPDAMVVFDRPPGYRGSYKQWEEANLGPQVTFESLSPSNTEDEMEERRQFFERHGVEEYYYIDPYANLIRIYIRGPSGLELVAEPHGFVSPRLGMRVHALDELKLFRADGREFLTRQERVSEIEAELEKTAMAFEEVRTRAIEEARRADTEQERADAEQERADAEQSRADGEQERADAEQGRADAEHERAEAEHERADGEQERAEAERARADVELRRADEAQLRAEAEQERANAELLRANAERQRADTAELAQARLAAKLRELGIDPADFLRPTG